VQRLFGFLGRLRNWLRDKLGDVLGGIISGIIQALPAIAIAVGLLLAGPVGWGVLAGLVIVGAGLGIYSRFQEYKADHGGKGPSFWEGVGLVGLGIADLTGIPYIVEASVGRRAFAPERMSTFERWERGTQGVIFLGLIAAGGAKKLLGKGPKPEVPLGEQPKVPGEVKPSEVKPSEVKPSEAKPAEGEPAGPAPQTRELGLRPEAVRAIERIENIKADPVGDINSVGNKNHYGAARREAGGEVVARRPDGRPYSHISDLQQGCDGLFNAKEALAREVANPPDTMTERGLDVLLARAREVDILINRLAGFLNQIGHGKFPPYHQWPPGS
ncbi:MAG: polymorphic toxin type 28 domain-containing protein, partial [Actinomycetota bacterium]